MGDLNHLVYFSSLGDESSLACFSLHGSLIACPDAGDYLVDVSVGKDVNHLQEIFDILNGCVKNCTYV